MYVKEYTHIIKFSVLKNVLQNMQLYYVNIVHTNNGVTIL